MKELQKKIPHIGLAARLTDPAETKKRMRRMGSELSKTIRSQIQTRRDSKLQMMSTEKQLDLKKVNEIAQQNQEDILLHKRLSEENKKICREFWHEQMLLRQKYKLLKDFI